jgi:cobalt-zinc-cadmium efflux system membrane fusion protein
MNTIIGLTDRTIRKVSLETYRQTMTVPATVVEKPGKSRVQVATPMTGAVMHVHSVEGAAVNAGELLFQIRLTHEDLVQAQTRFVKTLGELDVEKQEIERLKQPTSSGAISRKVLLGHQYNHDRLTAHLTAQKEALRLHGMSDDQVSSIVRNRRLLSELQMFAPTVDSHPDDELRLTGKAIRPVAFQSDNDAHRHDKSPRSESTASIPLILQELSVHKGQSVSAGDTLGVLTDFSSLYIEGRAFEYDIEILRSASEQGWNIAAQFGQQGGTEHTVEGLQLAFLSNEIDIETRSLRFYVELPNTVISDRQQGQHRFVEWKYFPGQRLELLVPVAEWTDRIVLPVEAVARDGAESYVFQYNGDHFDRVPVHVEFRDQTNAVIANDGAVSLNARVAMRGAHQMQMALRKKAGGGPDPHAGHSH